MVAREHAVVPSVPGAPSSARNRFVGLVTNIEQDTVMAQVELQCGPFRVVSLMSSEAVRDLGLERGSTAVAVIKSTNVVVETRDRRSSPADEDQLAGAGHGRSPSAQGLVACGDTEKPPTRPRPSSVYAASSLKSTFEQLGKEFEADHKGVKVGSASPAPRTWSRRSSRALPSTSSPRRTSPTWTSSTRRTCSGQATQVFATNTLEIAVPPTNPAHVATLADLAKKGVQLVVCAPEVPCGSAASRSRQQRGWTGSRSARSSRSPTSSTRCDRRGRCRPGLRDRRQGRGRQGEGHQLPARLGGGQHLPGRAGQGRQERRPGPPVRSSWSSVPRASRCSRRRASASRDRPLMARRR
jgi:molybdopterin-binding protein